MIKITAILAIVLFLSSCSQEQLEKLKEMQDAAKAPIPFVETDIRIKDNEKHTFLRITAEPWKSTIKDGEKKNIGHLTIKEDTCFVYSEANELIWRIQSTSTDSLIIKNNQHKSLFQLYKKKNSIRMTNDRKKLLYMLKMKSPRRCEFYQRDKLLAKGWVFGENIKIKNAEGEVLLTVYGCTNASTLFLTMPDFSMLQKTALFLIFHRQEPEVEPGFPF